jgi:metal-responsive CopG/Arc/MetJ family transcriptional regulator
VTRPAIGRPIVVRLGDDLLDEVDEWAAEHNGSRPDVIREAVWQFIRLERDAEKRLRRLDESEAS